MNIIENIQYNYNSLTNKQKSVADYLINKPSDICYISLATLSKNIGCSEVTILNFCQKIGLENFISLKDKFRNYNDSLVSEHSISSYHIPSQITDNDSKLNYLKDICNDELDKILGFYDAVDLENMLSISKRIIKKRVIYIFAHDASRSLAYFLKLRLDLLNLNVVLVDLSDMNEIEHVLKQITTEDISIFFSFPNYYYAVKSIAENVENRNCDIVLITDSLDCPVAECTDNILLCSTRTKIFYNSWVLPVALINILTSIVAMALKDGDTL